MTRNVALSAVAGGLVSLAAALAVAQDSAVLDDLYGRGVHAYFSHNSKQAVALLSEAIANGTADPRAYYFRGLALRTLGREEDAALDFQEGAKLEQGAVEWINVVSKSLERVQGATRLEIEKQRRVARLKTRNDRLAREKQRYEDITTEDERVLRRPAGTAPTTRPPAVTPETAPPPEAGDPFGDEPAARPAPPPAEPAEEKPTVPPEPAEETTEPPPAKPAKKPAPDPFSDDPAEAPAEKPAAEKPAAEKPAAEKTPVPPEPAEETTEPPPAKPAPKPAPDPFSDDPAEAPAEEPPAEKPPAEPAAEPEPEAAAAVAPAAKPGKASRSLFGALGKAIIGDTPAKKTSKIDVSNAKDPFAEDEAPVPVKAEPVPAEKSAPAEVEDPFK